MYPVPPDPLPFRLVPSRSVWSLHVLVRSIALNSSVKGKQAVSTSKRRPQRDSNTQSSVIRSQTPNPLGHAAMKIIFYGGQNNWILTTLDSIFLLNACMHGVSAGAQVYTCSIKSGIHKPFEHKVTKIEEFESNIPRNLQNIRFLFVLEQNLYDFVHWNSNFQTYSGQQY